MPNSGMPTSSAVPCFYSKGAPAQRDLLIITGGTESLRLLKPGIKATVDSRAGYQAELWQPYLQATEVQIVIGTSNRKEKSCVSSSHRNYNRFLGQRPGGEVQTLNTHLNSPSASPIAVALPQRAAGMGTGRTSPCLCLAHQGCLSLFQTHLQIASSPASLKCV